MMIVDFELVTTREAAKLLRVANVTMIRWRKEGRGPTWTNIGHKIFYERAVLQAWIIEQRHRPQPDPAMGALE